MHKLLRFVGLFSLITLPICAQVRHLGEVQVAVEKDTIAVRVSGNTAELNGLALQAFRSHGRYTVRGNDYSYDIRFLQAGPNQVRVEIMRGRETTPAFSETVSGTSMRNALLRAADVAVVKTNGQNLRGFFTARLAFVGEGTGRKEIYTSDLFGGEVRRMTNDRAFALSPRWAPDGSKIIYTSFYQGGFPDIYTIDMRTYQRNLFARFRGTNTGARYSPSGQQVAMVLTAGDTPEIFVGSASGGTPNRRTHSVAAKSSPCFSPDGSQIVFAMEPGPQLYVMPAAGGAPRRLFSGYRYQAEPDWSSANRNKIACTVAAGGYQIAVYDSSTGHAEVVSKAPFDGIEPCWLADGRHLVYTARDRQSSVLCILDTETGKSTPITDRSPVGASMQASVLFGN